LARSALGGSPRYWMRLCSTCLFELLVQQGPQFTHGRRCRPQPQRNLRGRESVHLL
jgi:hypothetical protein